MIKIKHSMGAERILERCSGIALNVPFAGHNSGNRLVMLGAMMEHRVPILDGDYRLVTTPHFLDITRSSENYVAPNKLNVLYRNRKTIFGKETSECVVIYQDDVTGMIELTQHNDNVATHENFGIKIHNDMTKDDVLSVEAGDLYIRSHSFDKNGVPKLFKNLRTIYMSNEETLEDAIYLTRAGQKMFEALKYFQARIKLDDNKVLKNIYGHLVCDDCGETTEYSMFHGVCSKCSSRNLKDVYKPLPLVGDKIQSESLMVMTGIELLNSAYVKNNELMRGIGKHDERLIFEDGTEVVNITVRVPVGVEPKNKFIADLAKEQQKYEFEVYSYMRQLYDDPNFRPYLSINFLDYYKDLSSIVNGSKFRIKSDVLERERHVLVEYELTKIKSITDLGQKLAGLFGNKGVTSVVGDLKVFETDRVEELKLVYLDADMYDEYGRPIHAVVNVIGVINRANMGQLFEHTLTSMSDDVLRHINSIKDKVPYDDNAAKKLLLDFIRKFTDRTADFYTKKIEQVGMDTVLKYFDSIGGIMWFIEPYSNKVELKTFHEARKLLIEHGVKHGPCRVRMGDTWIPTLFEVGTQSYMRLKQSTDSKFSVRKKGAQSAKGAFNKTTKKKEYKSKSSDTPMKLSALGVDKLANIFSEEDFLKFLTTGTEVVETAKAYLNAMGADITFKDVKEYIDTRD